MVSKVPIVAERIRKVPRHFSWIDHRLVRDRHIENCSHAAAALYLFLVTVGDAKGLSYYGDKSIIKYLSMDQNSTERRQSQLDPHWADRMAKTALPGVVFGQACNVKNQHHARTWTMRFLWATSSKWPGRAHHDRL